jgi:ATP-dependent DNA ligase
MKAVNDPLCELPSRADALCEYASWLPRHLGRPTLSVLDGTKKCYRRLHCGRPELQRDLIGDYEERALKYVAKVHAGFTPPLRAAVFKRFQGLETKTCPFENLPEARRGQWGEGLTAAEMEKCRWLKPRLVATIDYLERTAANHLRHPMFARLSEPKR